MLVYHPGRSVADLRSRDGSSYLLFFCEPLHITVYDIQTKTRSIPIVVDILRTFSTTRVARRNPCYMSYVFGAFSVQFFRMASCSCNAPLVSVFITVRYHPKRSPWGVLTISSMQSNEFFLILPNVLKKK